MILVIDGYNLIKQALKSQKISENERDIFIKRLDVYGKKKKLDITLVFDGGPYRVRTRERWGTLIIIYSGLQVSADEVIVDYLQGLKGYDVLLVSSDRSLRNQSRALGVDSIASLEFYELLSSNDYYSQDVTNGRLVKTTENSNQELDELMMQSVMSGTPKKVEHVEQKKPDHNAVSKEQRKLLKKGKKIMKNQAEKNIEMTCTLDDIEKVATKIASILPQCAIVTFTGLLGAGKTTLVKALLKECGVTDLVTSPTFTYVNVYKNNKGETFYHFDLYRIKVLEDFINAGFSEYLYQKKSWCFIEWPEHIMPLLEKNVCHVQIDYVEEELRHIRITIV